MRELMAKHLQFSSDLWCETSMGEAVVRVKAGGPLSRDFRITIAASQRLEKECQRQTAMLLCEAKLWSALPEGCLTVSHRCLVYRMLSRLACCVEELLCSEHRRYPIALFRLLDSPDAATAADIKGVPECVLDSFSSDFLGTYPDPTCDEALAVLSSVAALLKLDIAEIECRHAAIRRHLHTRVQTHVMCFSHLSGMWMSQQSRSKAAVGERGAIGVKLRPRKPAKSAERANLKRRRQEAQKKRRQGGGGGAHRAYFSEQLRLRSLSLRAEGVARMLWTEYKALTADQRARYEALGAQATARSRKPQGKTRVNSFGLPRWKRETVARAKKLQHRAFWHRLANASEDQRIDMLVETAMPSAASTGESYLEAIARAKALAKQGHDAAKAQLEDLDRAMQDWQAESGDAVAVELLQALGLPQDRVAALSKQMRAEPTPHTNVLHFRPDVARVASDLTGALHHGPEWSVVRSHMEEDSSESGRV